MQMNRFMVDDFEKLGQLIKDWAYGVKPIPADKAAFEAQLVQAGIVPTWPTGNRAINIVKVTPVPMGTLSLMVPPKELFDDSKAYLAQPGVKYPVPTYYQLFGYNVPPNITNLTRFHNMRTGDYTIGHCH